MQTWQWESPMGPHKVTVVQGSISSGIGQALLQRAPPAGGAGELHRHQQALVSEGNRDRWRAEGCGGGVTLYSAGPRPQFGSSENSRLTEVGVVKFCAAPSRPWSWGRGARPKRIMLFQLEVGKGLREVNRCGCRSRHTRRRPARASCAQNTPGVCRRFRNIQNKHFRCFGSWVSKVWF